MVSKQNNVNVNLTLLFIAIMLLLTHYDCMSQQYTQTIRGTVFDKFSRQTLPGANIIVTSEGQTLGTASDANGEFIIRNVAAGRCDVKASMIGFVPYISNNVLVYSGKETVLEIALEETALSLDEVVVTPKVEKELPLNKQAVVSARMFASEEANRYAGSWGDIGRMVSNLAGVASANDTKNDIIIRGNSPMGLSWRLDGFEIPNPNHFGEMGGTGGRIGMINNNQLANSDFYTGAFPAEFGNATSGIFDLRLRNGNNNKHEFLASLGFNGVEMSAEGPLSKGGASYLINGRYSFLDILQMMGVPMQSVPEYTDVSAKVNVPMKKANLSIVALAGKSFIEYEPEKDDDQIAGDKGTAGKMNGKQLFTGVNYTYWFNSATRIENRFSGQYFKQNVNQTLFDYDLQQSTPDLNKVTREGRFTYRSDISHRANSQNNIKTGLGIDMFLTEMSTMYKNAVLNDFAGNSGLLKAYAQWQHYFHPSFFMTAGMHGQYYMLNGDYSIEPRLGFKWSLSPVSSVSLGGGLYSQLQPRLAYFYKDNGELKNKSLKMTKSWQTVAGYNHKIADKFQLKAELYYQYLFNVPVIPDIPEESILNFGDEAFNSWNYVFVNKGVGANYGVELTLEKFFDNNYYFLLTTSLYQSQYKGYDGVNRSTKFAGNYSLNALLGYEWKLGKRNLLSVNGKVSYMGGKRYVPASVQNEGDELIYDYSRAYAEHLPAYFRADLNANLKINFKKVSLEYFFEIANLTNHKNVWVKHYNVARGSDVITYQYGLMPMGGLRFYF
ncbi:MAG: carboxypeptidase-like regulatory domain-containing protein [Dysgonamonadaceae bacterium]|jgi:hypothetical protein|nr:carboxypeptidase-like regulatory domain-containing protein [Dysgonamonadaceae bacterium]